jgi:hypothetical protein
MTEKTAVFAILFGVFAIVSGIAVKTFYLAKGMFGAMLSDRKIATWKGRVFFIVIGAIMLLIGVGYFLFPAVYR